MNNMAAFLLVCMVTAPQPASAVLQSDDGRFDFATSHTSAWDLTATTSVTWNDGYPVVDNVECRGEGRQFLFTMNSAGEISLLRIKFLSGAEDDDDREEITLLGDHLWLYVDSDQWEYANIPRHSSAFTNVPYPAAENEIILPVWRGHQAVRSSEGQPWVNLNLIYYRLINAHRIEWGFKSRDWTVVDQSNPENGLPRGWQTRRYAIDNHGFRDAISWCARQVSSQEAYILPSEMLERFRALESSRQSSSLPTRD